MTLKDFSEFVLATLPLAKVNYASKAVSHQAQPAYPTLQT